MTDATATAPAWTLENVEDEYTDYILWLPDTAGQGGRLRLTIDSAKRVAFCALTLDTVDGDERGELTGTVSLDWALAIAHAVNGYTLPSPVSNTQGEHMKDECMECSQPMWLEGTIGDDIALCHGCYSNETLEKFAPEATT